MTDAPTLSDLLAQRQELDKQIAAVELAPVQQALAELSKASTKALRDKMADIVASLPDSEVKTQINNVVIVLDNVPVSVQSRLSQLEALLAPPAEAEEAE